MLATSTQLTFIHPSYIKTLIEIYQNLEILLKKLPQMFTS